MNALGLGIIFLVEITQEIILLNDGGYMKIKPVL